MEDHRGRIHRWPSSALVRCGLLLEGVLYLLARVFQARLRLVDLAFVLGAAVFGGIADGLFGLAADVVNLVAHFVVGAHALLLPLDDLWSRWFASGGIYPACYRLKPHVGHWHDARRDPRRLSERRAEHGRLVRGGGARRHHRLQ